MKGDHGVYDLNLRAQVMLTKLRNLAGKDIELAKYKKLTITLNFATKREEVVYRDNLIRTRFYQVCAKIFSS